MMYEVGTGTTTIPAEAPCPNCGYCPHCGRSARPYRTAPWQPVPTWPPLEPPDIAPYWVDPNAPIWRITSITPGSIDPLQIDYVNLTVGSQVYLDKDSTVEFPHTA